MASLNATGKQPLVSDWLMNMVMDESSPLVFNQPRRCWIKLACLLQRAADQFRNLIRSHSGELDKRWRHKTSNVGVAAVGARTESILSLKYLAYY